MVDASVVHDKLTRPIYRPSVQPGRHLTQVFKRPPSLLVANWPCAATLFRVPGIRLADRRMKSSPCFGWNQLADGPFLEPPSPRLTESIGGVSLVAAASCPEPGADDRRGPLARCRRRRTGRPAKVWVIRWRRSAALLAGQWQAGSQRPARSLQRCRRVCARARLRNSMPPVLVPSIAAF